MIVLYLLALLISLTGMVVLDRRFSLFFWRDARRARIVLPVGVLFFLVWDLLGVGLGIFFRGETEFMTGLLVAPEVPLEEVFFLTLLCYLTMNVYGALTRPGDSASAASASATATKASAKPATEPGASAS